MAAPYQGYYITGPPQSQERTKQWHMKNHVSAGYVTRADVTSVLDVLEIIGATASAPSTAHYVEIIDVFTGDTIEHIHAPDTLRSCGTLEEVQDFESRGRRPLCGWTGRTHRGAADGVDGIGILSKPHIYRGKA